MVRFVCYASCTAEKNEKEKPQATFTFKKISDENLGFYLYLTKITFNNLLGFFIL